MQQRGFTLVEMVVSIVIGAIVAGFIAMFINTPIAAYFAQNRRSELSDSAEAAMRALSQDIGAALPNSVRTGPLPGRQVLELIPIDAGGKGFYRDAASAGTEDLDVTSSETIFDVLQPITVGANSRIVIGNRAVPAAETAYRATNRVITPAGMVVTFDAVTNQVQLPAPGFAFRNASAGRRLYVVSTATQYHCDIATGTLIRYTGLPIANGIVMPAGVGTIVARDVTACTFQFSPPTDMTTARHGGIAYIHMTISRVTEGQTDRMRLAQQIRVRNPP